MSPSLSTPAGKVWLELRAELPHVLVRGYDRAISMLARGVHSVPALVHGHRRPRDLPFGRSTLRRSVVLGRRPPLLPDFLDDDVSAEVFRAPVRRLMMVRAVEFGHYGDKSTS